jgi:peptidoglycan/LPS O-acetylase OafA/YrhL
MTNSLSLYLDALRFGAAFAVFVSHYATRGFSGGLFWQVMPYGRTAVLVFFVLSGFVIAWITETKERTLEEYALSRLARLYSVILPAFLITAVLDHIAGPTDDRYAGDVLGYALSLVFLGSSWTLAAHPGSCLPFWSLNYEAWYYILFAAMFYLRGRTRIIVLTIAGLLAGPKILLLFPIWLMGVWAWRWRSALPAGLGTPLALGALVAFAGLETLGGQQLFWKAHTPWLADRYSAYEYIVAGLVALLILGLANSRLPVPRPKIQRLIRGLAGTTFGLYLLHYPLLHFFSTVLPGPVDGFMHRTLLFALTLGTALTLANSIERRKGVFKSALVAVLDALRGRGLRPVSRT